VATNVNVLRHRLEAEQKHLIEQLGDGDVAVADEARELEICLLRQRLREVEYALCKFELGTYGLCDVCGQPIEPERLEVLPQANLCFSCKARLGKNGKR